MIYSEISEISEISLTPMGYARIRLRIKSEISLQRPRTLFRSQFRCACELSLVAKSVTYILNSLNSLNSLGKGVGTDPTKGAAR